MSIDLKPLLTHCSLESAAPGTSVQGKKSGSGHLYTVSFKPLNGPMRCRHAHPAKVTWIAEGNGLIRATQLVSGRSGAGREILQVCCLPAGRRRRWGRLPSRNENVTYGWRQKTLIQKGRKRVAGVWRWKMSGSHPPTRSASSGHAPRGHSHSQDRQARLCRSFSNVPQPVSRLLMV